MERLWSLLYGSLLVCLFGLGCTNMYLWKLESVRIESLERKYGQVEKKMEVQGQECNAELFIISVLLD